MSLADVATKVVNASVAQLINAPIEEVWPYVAAVGLEKLWYDGCTKSLWKSGLGKGSIRELHFGHGVYTERIDDCDPDTHIFAYSILPPHQIPGTNPVGVIQLERAGDNTTRIIWSAYADAWDAEQKDSLAELSKQVYQNSIAALEKLLETGAKA